MLYSEILSPTPASFKSTALKMASGQADTDAGRMLEWYFSVELRGGANEEARAHAKAALKLALALQHKRIENSRMAALCAEATSSVVNIVAGLRGRRGRSL